MTRAVGDRARVAYSAGKGKVKMIAAISQRGLTARDQFAEAETSRYGSIVRLSALGTERSVEACTVKV